MKLRFSESLSGVFLRNRSTNLNETSHIASKYELKENCRKKYLKNVTENFLRPKKILV